MTIFSKKNIVQVSKSFRMNQSEQIWTCHNRSEQVWTGLNRSEQVSDMHSGLVKIVNTYSPLCSVYRKKSTVFLSFYELMTFYFICIENINLLNRIWHWIFSSLVINVVLSIFLKLCEKCFVLLKFEYLMSFKLAVHLWSPGLLFGKLQQYVNKGAILSSK